MALDNRVEWFALEQQKNTLLDNINQSDQLLIRLENLAARYDRILATTVVGGNIRTWRSHLDQARQETRVRVEEMINFMDARLRESQTAFGITQDEIQQISNSTTVAW